MMTKEDWANAEKEYGQYSPVRLICDGYKVMFTCEVSVSKSKVYHGVWVNGEIKGLWLNIEKNHPESKFLYKTTKTIRSHTDKELRLLKRISVKLYEQMKPRKYESLSPIYPSFAAFKRRMIEVCENIELDKE